jgi:drug/metabolite transporter (DMT)-like permease
MWLHRWCTPCTHVCVCFCVLFLVTAEDVFGNVPACGCVAAAAFRSLVSAAFRRLARQYRRVQLPGCQYAFLQALICVPCCVHTCTV